jgi:hypothetical protein
MTQFFTYNPITFEYEGNYFAPEKTIEASTEVKPDSEVCTWNGTEWIDDRTDEEKIKDLVPFMVSRRQLKLQLVLSGFDMSGINDLIESLPEPDRTYARIGWEDATVFERTNPQLNAMSQMLGLSEYQLDVIFIEAEKL